MVKILFVPLKREKTKKKSKQINATPATRQWLGSTISALMPSNYFHLLRRGDEAIRSDLLFAMMVSNTINSWAIPVESGEIEKVTISPVSPLNVSGRRATKKKNGPETIDVFVRSNDIHFRLIYSILKHLHLALKRMRSFAVRRKMLCVHFLRR